LYVGSIAQCLHRSVVNLETRDMYSLQLTPEQLEFRDTLREFVNQEVKPVALHPDRLQPFEKPLLGELLDKASQMGLRTLALPEESGGAGADTHTICIVLEELASGDVDLAAALGETALVAREVFGPAMNAETREQLSRFTDDERCHLALAGVQAEAVGWSYHRPAATASSPLSARRQGAEWVIDGALHCVVNAPIAKLFAVVARTDQGVASFLVPRDTPGLTVGATIRAIGGVAAGGEPGIRWHHGPGSSLTFKDCRVTAARALGQGALASGVPAPRRDPALAAINLGVGRAAYEAAVDYAKIRRQGGRNIIEHQAIGGKLADCAMKLELARTMIWKAAWTADHPEAIADRSLPSLPLHAIARIYTAEAVHDVALLAAECFGAMGVMRDMPLQKYVHDSMVFLHSEETDTASKLAIAEAVAGYQRPLAA
jgi:alkylation response protein AidB-like acyl-CoA dehydrogenase